MANADDTHEATAPLSEEDALRITLSGEAIRARTAELELARERQARLLEQLATRHARPGWVLASIDLEARALRFVRTDEGS